MKINPSIFRAYDIRGVYPTDINEENLPIIIQAIYTFFVNEIGKKRLTILLGRDMRLSSPGLHQVAIDTLVNLGAYVFDADLIPTPTFYFTALKQRLDGGILISASHNPPQWNGLKLIRRDGDKIIKIGKNTGMSQIKQLVERKNFVKKIGAGKIKKITQAVKEEVDYAFKLLKPQHIKKLKLVVDPANAMAILYFKGLFSRLPCQLIKMNFFLDGSFPAHQPDPLKFKNLVDIEKKVIEEKADLGIAPDGDGDRVFFIDEKGKVIPASLITALVASEMLKKHPGDKIGVDIRYTGNVANAVKKAGGRLFVGRVGHALITEMMNQNDILFTGESSGHFFFRDVGYAESSVLTILIVLEVVGRKNKPISQIVSQYLTSIESGEINFTLPKGLAANEILKTIADNYQDGKISWLDGLAVDYPNWRFSIRASNTEPLIRLNVEGKNRRLVNQKTKELKKKIIEKGAKIKN